VTGQCRPRIQAFRRWIIDILPRAPNDRASRKALEAMPTRRLILAFLTWQMRRIPAKPRKVALWSRGVTPRQFQAARLKLLPLLRQVEAGKDLTPHLSDLVRTKGIVLTGAAPSDRGKDIDAVLARHGLHHFHVGIAAPGNPKGRSGSLVFAEVLDREFRIVAISDHRVFKPGSPEQRRFFRLCGLYTAKAVPAGQAFMANPVMASGHSLLVTQFANNCEAEIGRLDPLLDDPAFVDRLYHGQPILRDGPPVARPMNPSPIWYFDDLRFGILDKRTMVFFCIFPFFAR
jgi:hypothetical protein